MTEEAKTHIISEAISHANGPDEIKPRPVTVQEQIFELVNGTLTVFLNGILYSLRMVPTDRVLVMVCRVLGRMVGEVLSAGDLPKLLMLRKECREAFEKALREVDIKPPPSQQTKQPIQH